MIGSTAHRATAAGNPEFVLKMGRRVKVAARVAAAVAPHKIHADGDHVVTADVHVRRRMRKTAVLQVTIALSAQKLPTNLTKQKSR